MADKDKIKGWTSYTRNLWRRLVSTDIGFFFLIEFAVVVMGAIAGVIIWFSRGFTTLSDGLEFARLFIAVMIAVGGAYGLILATRRAVKFSEQVDTAQKQVNTTQKQLFNEQLGRGAELLANGKIVMRQTGIRVLGNLAEKTIGEPDQVKLIMQIIHDFIRSNTKRPSEGKGTKDKDDIVLGIKTLASLYSKLGQLNDLKELLKFSECYLGELSFKGADLQGVNFGNANLQEANFRGAELQEANFNFANLQGANFIDADLQEANFRGAELQGAHFGDAKLQRVCFYSADLQWAHFDYAELQRANFGAAKLQGAFFIGAKLQGADFKDANLQWMDCTDVDFLDAENLTKDQVKVMVFEDAVNPKLPDGLKQFLNKRYGYKFEENLNNDSSFYRRFVKSNAEWSEKLFHEYLAEIGILNPEDD